MAQTHSFSVPLAVEYGDRESNFLSNLCFWIEKNIANERHYYDGKWWTYNSVSAFCKLFPYYTENQVRTIISNLQRKQALIIGNYNKHGYDKTQWFAVSPKVFTLWKTGSYDCPITDFVNNSKTANLKTSQQSIQKTAENNNKTEVKTEKKSCENTLENGNSPSLQNCQVHVGEFTDGVCKIAKSICENSQMDLGEFTNGFVNSHRPIPDLTKYKTAVAVAQPEKNPEILPDVQKETAATADIKINSVKQPSPHQAGTNKTASTQDALKSKLLQIDKELVMYGDFYDRAVKFMLANGLDKHYLKFVYDECIKKKDHSNIRGLYYKMFFEEDICGMFKAIVSPPALKEIEIVCPVCGLKHIKQTAVCPECGLENMALSFPARIEHHRQVFLLGDKKIRYEREIAEVVSNLSDFLSVKKRKTEIDAKYGITA